MHKTRKNHRFFVSRKFYKFSRKSQAALEFLTTYAWAFLVILIMIGALAYFGILNPSSLLPERCNFGTEIGCNDYKLDATNSKLKLKIVNNVGDAISITKITTTSEGVNELICEFTIATPVAPGDSEEFDLVTCATSEWTSAGFVVGQKGKVSITLTYNTIRSGPNYPHDIKGEIFATVQ